MSVKIPYVISESHPDYKRPWLNQQFGSIDENLKDTFFVEKAVEFIYERIDAEDIESVDDIQKFWDNYYDDCYMDNSPWDARIYINGEWENVCPTNIEIFECIQRIKSGEKINKEEPSVSSDDEEIEFEEFEFTEEEEKVQQEMKKYMESELDKSDLESMSKMNNNEQIIYVLNKCMLNISSDKYKSNRELFYKFLNIILKYTEKDIAKTTEEMTANHDEKISLKLNYLMNIYGSLLEYRTIFNMNG